MPRDTVVLVSDVHLGQAPNDVTADFHRFLAAVPARASHLIINGDLFQFWFEYGSVIPRAAFPTLSALDRLREAGVRLTVTGGNHDRWGGAFWREQLGADFYPAGARLVLAGHTAWVAHGDGLAEKRLSARILHWLTRRRVTARLFRWLHPDVGYPLVERLSMVLADSTRDSGPRAAVAAVQAAYAHAYLARHPDIDLVALGHTHQAVLESGTGDRWYLNPGAWVEGRCYATIDAAGPALHRFA